MADENEKDILIRPEFPTGRVKKIMKMDQDVQRVSSEALFLMSCSTELFLQFLAEKSAQVALEKKRKTVKLEHIRIAVKRHQPTSDFLLDSLPLPSLPVNRPPKDRSQSCSDADKPPPSGTRRIDHIFRKAEGEAPAPRDET